MHRTGAVSAQVVVDLVGGSNAVRRNAAGMLGATGSGRLTRLQRAAMTARSG